MSFAHGRGEWRKKSGGKLPGEKMISARNRDKLARKRRKR